MFVVESDGNAVRFVVERPAKTRNSVRFVVESAVNFGNNVRFVVVSAANTIMLDYS